MSASAVVPGPQETVALTFLPNDAEQRTHLGAPRHHREFIDGRDHHRGRAVVDLLVDELHRDARMRIAIRARLAELALGELVTTIDGRAPGDLINLDVAARLDF